MIKRPRRNRKSPAIRSLVQETTLHPQDLVVPFFIVEGINRKEEIPNMPGVYKMSQDLVVKEAEKIHSQGVPAIALFPSYPKEKKDPEGKEALNPKGIIPNALKFIKKEIPSLCLITDVALDPFTSHGHDGLADDKGEILNDPTVEVLANMALLSAEYGADYVAPSDMMDGRVKAIRHLLDEKGFSHTGIISYSAKYASSLYGPFRDALGSHLAFGDKKSYQLSPCNVREALLEAKLDEEEGADALMVKPALFYLDIISKIKEKFYIPVCAYHVSGEYALVMAAHQKGIVDAERVFLEALMSIKRAGADFIFTYAAPFVLPHIR